MDLHCPKTLDDFKFQPSVNILKQFLKKEIPNLIFYGPSGSGKKSLLYRFLNEKYGIEHKNTKCIQKIFKINSKELEIPYFYSNYHIEIKTSDLANYARIILPEIIKKIGSTRNIVHDGCKILIIHQAEKLDLFTQNMLRRFFEIYSKTCRFILITKHLNNIIEPLQSRCLMLRVPAPSLEQINSIIKTKSTHRNMKMVWIEQYVDIEEEPIKQYLKDLLKGKNTDCREILYSILVKNRDFLEIIRIIYDTVREELKDDKLRKAIEIIAKYSRRLREGTREIMHMEAMIMSLKLI